MGDKEFHEVLGKIVDSDENAIAGILHAQDDNARKTAIRNFANAKNINLDPRDIDDLASCSYQMGGGRPSITIRSVRY
jgi:hypothetical protein